ncbi:hypothetical protein [Streptomyces sp. AC627_RSS907]|uniref:hypothetical protein n=1 Tax=Streptomyces sp. AC627_RSS907 TaxID=2823684 RepID=UPI001C215D0B|nr:hypothetical protein [Streptomyces sp. AC627_RSS907]
MLLVDGDVDGPRFSGTDPATLLAVIVLARAARDALQGDTNNRCCGVNPLHGPSVDRRHVRISAEGNRRRMLSLCPLCLDSAVAAPRELRERMLTLPGPASPRVPCDEPEGSLLSVLGDGISRLVDRVRESARAH